MSYSNTPAEVRRMTYASPAEVRKMRKLREQLGIAQRTVAHSLWIPLRTWQQWEAYGDRPGDPTAGSAMYRVIWQRAMAGLESAQSGPDEEAEAQGRRAALGLPPLDP